MARYRDTKFNDSFIGTMLDDKFIMTRGGSDDVDGGEGFDTMEVDHSALKYQDDTSTFSYIYLLDYMPGMTGTLSNATIADTDIDFYDIERINYIGTKRDDAMTLDVFSTDVNDANLILDGFTGDDALTIYMDVGLDLTLTDNGPEASSNIGQFSNWDDYEIHTDRAENDDITLGGGDDYIGTFMSQGSYDGGDGDDHVVTSWDGSPYGILSPTQFSYTASNRMATFSQNFLDPRVATFENIENYSIYLSDYSEFIDIEMNGFDSIAVNGGNGTNYLTLRFQNNDGTIPSGSGTVSITNDNFSVMSVDAAFIGNDGEYSNQVFAEQIHDITVFGSDNNDHFSTNIVFSLDPISQVINGASGFDTMTIISGDFEFTSMQVNANGDLVLEGQTHTILLDGIEKLDYTGLSSSSDLEIARFEEVYFEGSFERQFDTLSYAGAETAVTVSLATTSQQDTGAGLLTAIGADWLIGSDFGDTLNASAGGDTLDGANGNDTLVSGSGGDTLTGGSGVDTVSYVGASGGVVVALIVSGFQNTGGGGSDSLSSIENLTGSAFADSLYGTTASNRLTGGNGNDLMSAASGADQLVGGLGADTLYGGLGADRFIYNSTRETSGSSTDSIMDFNRGESDKVDLSLIDASTTAIGNNSFLWIGKTTFTNVAGQLRYATVSAGNYTIQGDTNGDGVADLTINVASPSGVPIGTDFIL